MAVMEIALVGALAVAGFMGAAWIISVRIKDSSIVDILWGPGFVLITWLYFALGTGGVPERKLLVGALVTLWGARLALHLGARNLGKPEDYRYRSWREATGRAWWWRSLFKVFLLQGAVLWVVALPLLVAQTGPLPEGLTALDGLGLVVWTVGFLFEAVGDWQLRRFKDNPANRGRLLRTGLWRYTRHPNYFGDSLVWWGMFLIALGVPGGWLTVVSPLLMTLLLLRVSGVALLERNLRATRPEYADYEARTNAFFPWWPRESGTDTCGPSYNTLQQPAPPE